LLRNALVEVLFSFVVRLLDMKFLDFPRMIAKVEKMNMRQENHETGQETKDIIEPQKESKTTLL
jgi:hypothetical protein